VPNFSYTRKVEKNKIKETISAHTNINIYGKIHPTFT
jgi:hypothetical protein